MARPTKDGMDYFPHDTDALNDEKIETLMMLYGSKGYAFYFILLERIYRNHNFEIDISDTETRLILSRKIAITIQEFDEILISALKHKCFDREIYETRGILTSNGIKKRTLIVMEKRKKNQQYYNEQIKIVSASEIKLKHDRNSAESTQSIVNKSKVKENKEQENIYIHILDYLNQKCGTKYRLGETTKKHINARLVDKYTFDDFKTVIDKKYTEWVNTDQSLYLRPETLFGTKFDTYLNQPAKTNIILTDLEKEKIRQEQNKPIQTCTRCNGKGNYMRELPRTQEEIELGLSAAELLTRCNCKEVM